MPDKVFGYILGKDDRYTKYEIHNIPGLYKMCLSKGKSDTYNGVSIDDILVDAENIEKYKNGISGYRIVETSIGHNVAGEYAFIMNCPAGESSKSQVKIIFEDKRTFWRVCYRLMDSKEPIIIAGDWEPTPDAKDAQSQCIIHRKKQIYYVKE